MHAREMAMEKRGFPRFSDGMDAEGPMYGKK
jgi:hypothetical protein